MKLLTIDVYLKLVNMQILKRCTAFKLLLQLGNEQACMAWTNGQIRNCKPKL